MTDDSDIVIAARNGDLQAFETLVDRYQGLAMGTAYGWLEDRELARDATQEAFLDVYTQLTKLRDPGAFGSWLRRIVVKHCDRLTRRRSLPEHLLDAASEAADPAETLAKAALHEGLRSSIEQLPRDERVVIALQYFADASGNDIAEFLDLPLSTVKKRLRNARSRLRDSGDFSMTQHLDNWQSFEDPTLPREIRFFIALRHREREELTRLIKEDRKLLEATQQWSSDYVGRGLLPFANRATPLITAIELDDLETVTLLLDAGADVNGVCECATGESPLWTAVLFNREAHARFLIDRGANVNQRSATGNYPLHLAVMRSLDNMVQLLLDRGANASLRDQGARAGLPWAPAAGTVMEAGRTAMDWARDLDQPDIIAMLEAAASEGAALNLGDTGRSTTTAQDDVTISSHFILTGLKSLDLFAPITRGGIVRIPFKAGVGMVVLLGELAHRFTRAADRIMIWTGFTQPPYDLQDWRAEMAEFDLTSHVECGLESFQSSPELRRARLEQSVRSAEIHRDTGRDVLVVLQSSQGFEVDVDAALMRLSAPCSEGSITTLLMTPMPETSDAVFQEVMAPFTGQIMLDRTRAHHHLYPAINPAMSHSSVLQPIDADSRHQTLANRARALINAYQQTDNKLANVLSPENATDPACRLLKLLCQPFHVTAPFTGRPGESVPLDQLLDQVEAILAAAEVSSFASRQDNSAVPEQP